MQRGSSTAEMQSFGDGDEVAQLAQVGLIHTLKVSIIALYCIGLQYNP
jgi:hypothetical protein